MEKVIDFDKNGNWFCDESGFSGGIKDYKDYGNFLKQPIFIVAGIFVRNKDEFEKIEKDYKEFLVLNNIDTEPELKNDLFSPKNNQLLQNFIDLFIDKDYWYISVIDKKFDLCVDALWLFFPDTIGYPTYNLYGVLNFYKNKTEFLLKQYFDLIKTNDIERFYNNIVDAIDFQNNKISLENVKKNFKIYMENKKYLKFSHVDSLAYLFSMIENHPVLNILDASFQKYNVYYDKNTEFEQLKLGNYFGELDVNKIKFVDSKDSLLIQFSDNITRVFNKYFKYKLYEKSEPMADGVFKKLNVNLFGKANLMLFSIDQEKFMNSNIDFRNVIDDWLNSL